MMKEFVNRRIALVRALISAGRMIQPNVYVFFSSLWEVAM